MSQLIEVENIQALSSSLTLRVGDLLVVRATGGHIQLGADIVEILGPFVSGLMREDGEIVSPMGSPNTIMFLARRSGTATIDVMTGDPWYSPHKTTVELVVKS